MCDQHELHAFTQTEEALRPVCKKANNAQGCADFEPSMRGKPHVHHRHGFEAGRRAVRRSQGGTRLKDRNVAAFGNENTQLFAAALLIEIKIQALAQETGLRSHDAVVVRIIVGGPFKDLYTYLLLRDLAGSPTQSTLADIAEKFGEAG